MTAPLSPVPAFMSPEAVALVLVVAVVIACARLLLKQYRAEPASRSRGWRIALLVFAQPLCAVLLYFALWPPTVPGEAGTLIVATGGATRAQADAARGDTTVALPEANAWDGVARVPDLATALRQHPGTQRVRVIGAGLNARDRDAARGVALDFVPAPLPRGLVELDGPDRVAAGASFRIGGRANEAGPNTVVELLDPARRRVDRVAVGADGRFVLTANARTPGAATFTVRLRDASQRTIEDVAWPLQIEASPPPRVLLVAGAPGPEVKYLRRWADDAGLPLRTQMSVGGGVQLGDAPVAFNAGSLARFDIVVLDERAWSTLGDAQRGALHDAVRNGLGLLVRVTAALSDAERRRLRALGFDVDAGRDSAAFQLAGNAPDDDAVRARLGPGTRDAPRAHDAVVEEVPQLTRRSLRVRADDSVQIAAAQDGAALGQWRAMGRGRVGVWTATDTYRLVLAGRDDLHSELWSDVVATLARAKPGTAFSIEGAARAGERVALCGLPAVQASVTTPAGVDVPVLRDPTTGSRACAAFWPREGGWHRLRSGEREQWLYVRAANEAPGLRANELRTATLALATSAPAVATTNTVVAPRHPTSRWPWWLSWLLASVALWWFERSRLGRRAA
ncbi:carboxypeptidase regulatory-like domain-containing protein [Lysobacter panacisoli]|uniref:Carboxypeptidase regulatory-like domain-containing protein n=1 Tax=Lysobacter panacisoli TaxID=1255263 RepID=A0ABP9LNX3_9GAMM|nr:carboxypeptidase regulatory-like domain-containing protein [Lysobacter panacisoli]